MRSYYLDIDTKTKTNRDNLTIMINKGLNLGLEFDNWEKKLFAEEAVDILCDRLQKGTVRGRLDSNPFLIHNIGFLFIECNDHYYYWKKQFKYAYIPDNIRASRILLELTEDFLIDRFSIASYLKLINDYIYGLHDRNLT